MTINFKIDEDDFVTHQLYIASKSDRIKKTRQRNRWLLSIVYILLGLFFISIESYSSSFLFMVLGMLRPLYYPFFEKRRYVKHYKSLFKENFVNKSDSIVTLEFDNDFIFVKEGKSESKVHTSEIMEINEILTMIFIKLKGGQSLLLPKNKIENIESLKTRLQELAVFLKINYSIDEKWAWK